MNLTDAKRYEIRDATGTVRHATGDQGEAMAHYGKLAAAGQAVALVRAEIVVESDAHAVEREQRARVLGPWGLDSWGPGSRSAP